MATNYNDGVGSEGSAYFVGTDGEWIPASVCSTIPSQYQYERAYRNYAILGPGQFIPVNFDSKKYEQKHCAYCGNVNAPDARSCCGCQHAI